MLRNKGVTQGKLCSFFDIKNIILRFLNKILDKDKYL